LNSGTCFGILARVLGFWHVFWDSGTCFGILGRVLDSGACFGILGRVLDSGMCFVLMSHRIFQQSFSVRCAVLVSHKNGETVVYGYDHALFWVISVSC